VKIAQQAGKAAPAVAVIGAIASAPQIYDHLTSAPAAVTEHQGTALSAQATGSGSASNQRGLDASRLGSMSVSQVAQVKRHAYRARHTKPASEPARTSGKHHHRHTATTHHHHHSSGHSHQHASLHCSGSGGYLPDNYAEIVSFLTAHGYTGNAAAGIAGNIYQESHGDPESVGSGGGGLIGWTPLPGGLVTGNPSADLQAQLDAILTYNQGWAQYIPALNSAGSPAAAADIYVTDFERAGIPAASNREAAANAVAQACAL
jgi:tail lysozyme